MPGYGYNVYKVQNKLAMQDHMMGNETRYHTVIFVETQADGGGYTFHVTGDLVKGMKYESKPGNPELSRSFHAKTYLGRIRREDYPARLDQVLQTVPPPHRQRAFNPDTMATEQIKPDGSFYRANEQRPPFIKCTEWTEQRALPTLYQYQLLHNDLAQAPLQGGSGQAQTAQVATAATAASTEWVWDENRKSWRYWNGQNWVWQ
ncbi:Nn.00g094830.m01.CDS01 [Neocucurbitaria sp. VM-36]